MDAGGRLVDIGAGEAMAEGEATGAAGAMVEGGATGAGAMAEGGATGPGEAIDVGTMDVGGIGANDKINWLMHLNTDDDFDTDIDDDLKLNIVK